MRRRIRRRLRSVLHRSRVERELDLELQFHLDMLAAQKARAGLPPAAAERAARQAFGAVAVLALGITATGIAGVVGYAVQQRRREFGVRLALGAPRTRVLGMVLGQGLSLVVLGLFAGACASLPILPLIRALTADSARFNPLVVLRCE